MLAEKVGDVGIVCQLRYSSSSHRAPQTRAEQTPPVAVSTIAPEQSEEQKEGVIAKRKIEQLACKHHSLV